MAEEIPGLDVDVGITLNKLTRQLAVAEARMNKTASDAERRFGRANRNITGGFGSANRAASNFAGGGLRQVSLQLSQVAQQGSVTGDYVRALAIQLPDLALGFGTVGIAIGAVAGALGPLAIDMLSAGNNTEEFAKMVEAAEKSLGELDKAIDGVSVDDIIDKFGRFNESLRDLAIRQTMTDLRASADQVQDILSGISGRDITRALPTDVQTALDVRLIIGNKSEEEIRSRIAEISRDLELGLFVSPETLKELTDLTNALDLIDQRGPIEVQADISAVERAQEVLGRIPEALKGDLDRITLEGISADIESVRAALEGAGAEVDRGLLTELDSTRAILEVLIGLMLDVEGVTGEAGERLSDAEKEAQKLSEKIGDAGVEALKLADVDIAGGISDATREAAKLAGNLGIALSAAVSLKNLRDNQEYSGRGGDPRDFENQPTDPESGDRIQRQIDQFNRQDNRRRGGGRSGTQREHNELLREAQSLYEGTRTGAEAYAEGVARLDEIERGLTDTERESVDWIETKRRALDDLAQQYDATRIAADFLEQTIGDAFIDAIVGANSFRDAMYEVAQAIARAALEAALFGTGPFSGLFGGSGNGLIGAITGKQFATGGFTGLGGKYEPAGIVHKGEYVFDQEATRRIGVGNLEALSKGVMPNLTGVNVSAPAPQVNVAAAAAPNVSVTAVVADDPEAAMARLGQTTAFEQRVVAIMERNRGDNF